MVQNRVIDYFRAQGTRQNHETAAQQLQTDWETATDNDIAFKELKQVYDQALQTLSPQMKTIFLLPKEQGYDNKTIAAALNLGEQTVKNQLSKAKVKLRPILLAHLKNETFKNDVDRNVGVLLALLWLLQ
jgi:RNA polymerase sigma factor (sigma-70 family)